MRLFDTPTFRRQVRKLAPAQRLAVERALDRLAANPADPALWLHNLSGRLAGQWEISAGYDLRVVCAIRGDAAYLLTVGSPDEVY